MKNNLPKLYSKNTSGKLIQWEIIIEENKYKTIAGQVDGKLVESKYTVCEGKNIGKANETSPNEQALKEAQAIHKKKIEEKYFLTMNEVKNFKRNEVGSNFKVMLANNYNDQKDKISFPVYSQPKLDGIRCYITKDGMFSRTGKPIVSCSHIFESLKCYFIVRPNVILDGELYNHKFKHNFNRIASLVSKQKVTDSILKETRKNILYYNYDLYINDKKFSKRFPIEIFPTEILGKYIRPVDTICIHSFEELDKLYEHYLEKGYEGQIIRIDEVYQNKRTNYLLKRKKLRRNIKCN